MRVGIGYDVHAFKQGRPLVLGGVTLEGKAGLAGWSDGDVLSHAIVDALLGAAGLQDIGSHFPADEVPEAASSLEILQKTRILVDRAGYTIVNIDATLVIQEARIAPHRTRMTREIGRVLAIEPGRLSIKATTTDGLGFTGRSEGAAGLAVALLQEADRGMGKAGH